MGKQNISDSKQGLLPAKGKKTKSKPATPRRRDAGAPTEASVAAPKTTPSTSNTASFSFPPSWGIATSSPSLPSGNTGAGGNTIVPVNPFDVYSNASTPPTSNTVAAAAAGGSTGATATAEVNPFDSLCGNPTTPSTSGIAGSSPSLPSSENTSTAVLHAEGDRRTPHQKSPRREMHDKLQMAYTRVFTTLVRHLNMLSDGDSEKSRHNLLPPQTASMLTDLQIRLGDFETLNDRVLFVLSPSDDISNNAVAEAETEAEADGITVKPEKAWTTSPLEFWEMCEEDHTLFSQRVEIQKFIKGTVWNDVARLQGALVEAYDGPECNDPDVAKLKKFTIKFTYFAVEFQATYRKEMEELEDIKKKHWE